jgi:Flp pilus assembly protein protease CpaA
MVIDALLVIVGFAGLIVATFSDIRTREVPDWLNYSLIPAGIGLRLIHSLIFNDWMFLFYGLIGLLSMVALAYFLYYARQWGGGDSKLLMGIGVLFATYPDFMRSYFMPVLNWPFLLIFLFNLLAVGAVYALIWSVFLAIRHWNKFRQQYVKQFALIAWLRRVVLAIAAAMVFFSFIVPDADYKIVLVSLAMVVFVTFHLMLFARVIESCCMFVALPVAKLTEGDWVMDEVKVRGKHVCGPKDYGITKQQIAKLQKTRVKKVVVKEGIPFVPTFLIAMIVSLVWGNVIYLLF